MKYREFKPSPRLARYVERFWILEASGVKPPEAILPDGRMELILNFGDPFHRIYDDGAPERQPRSFLVGQIRRHMRIQPAQWAGVLGIRFRPAGAYALLKSPQEELTEQTVSIDLLWGAAARELEQRVLEARTNRQKIEVAEGWLLTRIGDGATADRLAEAAVECVLSSGGLTAVENLAAWLGVTGRHLERRFQTFVGLTPKRFSRIIRFQRVLRLLRRPDFPGWASTALEGGYYDQAHLIREFRELAGEKPSFYLGQAHPLTDCFTEKG